MHTISLVTGHRMPKPDPQTPALISALAERGIAAEISIWGEARDWASVSLVLVRSPWDHQPPSERRSEFFSWARRVEAATMLRNPAAVLEWNSHQRYLHTITDAAVPTVPTILMPKGAGVLEQQIILDQHRGRIMIKPAVPVAGVGALRAKAESERALVHLAAAVQNVDVLVQPFVESLATEGVSSLIYIGGEYSHAVVRTGTHGGGHRIGDQHGRSVSVHEASVAERRVADAAMAQVPAETASARVDLVSWEGGPAVLRMELIDPDLFLQLAPGATDRLAEHVEKLLA